MLGSWFKPGLDRDATHWPHCCGLSKYGAYQHVYPILVERIFLAIHHKTSDFGWASDFGTARLHLKQSPQNAGNFKKMSRRDYTTSVLVTAIALSGGKVEQNAFKNSELCEGVNSEYWPWSWPLTDLTHPLLNRWFHFLNRSQDSRLVMQEKTAALSSAESAFAHLEGELATCAHLSRDSLAK